MAGVFAVASLGALPSAQAQTPVGPPTLTRCHALTAGSAHQSLDNGAFHLKVFSNQVDMYEVETTQGPQGPDGNGISTWFRDDRTGKYQNGHDATVFALYCNGDLALRRSNGILLWHSGTAGKGGSQVTLNSAGNLVITRPDRSVVWQSGSGRAMIPAAPSYKSSRQRARCSGPPPARAPAIPRSTSSRR